MEQQRPGDESPASRQDPSEDAVLCPSARCEDGAILLGIVGADGVIGYITPQIIIDEAFVAVAHQGRAPEKRFRFSQPCIEGRCQHWTGSNCAVIDRALDVAARTIAADITTTPLPRCSIRARCRWFAQEGPDACRVCPYVITDLWPDEDAEAPPTP